MKQDWIDDAKDALRNANDYDTVSGIEHAQVCALIAIAEELRGLKEKFEAQTLN